MDFFIFALIWLLTFHIGRLYQHIYLVFKPYKLQSLMEISIEHDPKTWAKILNIK